MPTLAYSGVARVVDNNPKNDLSSLTFVGALTFSGRVDEGRILVFC